MAAGLLKGASLRLFCGCAALGSGGKCGRRPEVPAEGGDEGLGPLQGTSLRRTGLREVQVHTGFAQGKIVGYREAFSDPGLKARAHRIFHTGVAL